MTSTNEKHKVLNRLHSLASQALVIIWASLAALWTKPFLAAYYQKLANSHLEPAGVQWLQMGPVFVVALLLSIGSFVKKRYFIGVLTLIIALWAFFWAFIASFVCPCCT